jgi:hypothetical protein
MLNKIGASNKKNLRSNLQALPYVNVNPASKNELDMNLDAAVETGRSHVAALNLKEYLNNDSMQDSASNQMDGNNSITPGAGATGEYSSSVRRLEDESSFPGNPLKFVEVSFFVQMSLLAHY